MALVALSFLAQGFAVAAAEVATLKDGQVIAGRLLLGNDGQLRFRTDGATRPDDAVPAGRLHRIDFAETDRVQSRSPLVHRIQLAHGERLTGELVALDGQALTLRTLHLGTVRLPRTAVVGLSEPYGYATLVIDDFEEGTNGWRLDGGARRGEPATSGRFALQVAAQQSVRFALPKPLAAGCVSFNLRAPPAAHGRLVAVFDGAGNRRTVSLHISDTVRLEAEGLPGQSRRLPRPADWCRVWIEFSASRLSVTLDNAVLWQGDLDETSLRLERLSLTCDSGAGLALDDFNLAKAVPPAPRGPGDTNQDELWLASGDQLFGELVRADRRSITFRGCFGTRDFAWHELRGCYLRREPQQARKQDREYVRVSLRSGVDAEDDELNGIVRALDAHRLAVEHATLGRLEIDRKYVRRLRLGLP